MTSPSETPIGLKFVELKIGTEPKTMEIADLSVDTIRMINDKSEPKERKYRHKIAKELRDYPVELRTFIIYHVFRCKQSAENSYESLCEIGDNMITREDVDAWFQQYTDSIREYNEQYSLFREEVSRELATLVDQKNLKSIGVCCKGDHIHVKFNDFRVVYTSANCQNTSFVWDEDYHGAIILRNENYLNMALDDLKFAIKDPQLKLDELNINFFKYRSEEESLIDSYDHIEEFRVKLETILKSFAHQISTKKFETRTESLATTLMILPCLEPVTLQHIEFRQRPAGLFGSAEEVDQISNLEQWKQATELSIGEVLRFWDADKHLAHFKRFNIYEKGVGFPRLLEWKNFCTRSKTLEYCELRTHYKLSGDFRFGFGSFVSMGDDGLEIIHHSIPDDSKHFLEIRVHPERQSIVFTKMAHSLENSL